MSRKRTMTVRRILTTDMILFWMSLDGHIRWLIVSVHASTISDRKVLNCLIEKMIMPFVRFIARFAKIQYRTLRYRTAVKHFLNRFILMYHDLSRFILMHQWWIMDASISPASMIHRLFGFCISDVSINFRKINDASIINPRINDSSVFYARINDASNF